MSKKILIIDDNAEVRDNLKTLLDEMKFRTNTAEDGINGLLKAREFKPDLILCDIMMPIIDGYKVFSELKKSKKTKNIPFIFLTAKTGYSDFRKGMGLGADDYLTKPVTTKELLTAIDVRLKKHERILKKDEKTNSKKVKKTESPLNLDEKIYLPLKDGYFSIKIKDIDYILSAGAYTNIYHNGGKKVLVRKLLKEWEKILPLKDFSRVHRSTIINTHIISKIEKWFNNSLKIHIKDYEEPILASRRYSMKFRNDMMV